MQTFHVHSVKRDNGKIIGVAGFFDQFKQPIRIYQEISHVYYTQFTGEEVQYLVHYYNNENPSKESTFRLKAEKKNESYEIVIPENQEQKAALEAIPEYVYHPMDAT